MCVHTKCKDNGIANQRSRSHRFANTKNTSESRRQKNRDGKMLIASASNNQTIAPSSSVKLRRSRRLSSTRGLKQRTIAHPPKDPLACQDVNQKLGPTVNKNAGADNNADRLLINWEVNERISLSSGSSTGLAVRADTKRGIEFSENRRRVSENRSKISDCSEPSRGAKFSSSAKPALQLMNVSGFPANIDRKHRGSWSIETDTTDENVIKSDSKYEIGIPSRSFATRKQRQQDTLRKVDADTTRRWTKNKTGDSISKRLELIHELNQKILANYERFQQRSKRAKDAKEQAVKNRAKETDPEEHVYTEIKRKSKMTCRTSDWKGQKIPKQDTPNHNTSRRDCPKQNISRQIDIGKFTFSKDHRERIGAKDGSEKKEAPKVTNKPDRRIVCENTNFSLAVKDDFRYEADNENTRSPSTRAKSKDRKGRRSEGSSIFYTNEEPPPLSEMISASSENCLENSRLYPESRCIPGSEKPRKDDGCAKEDAKENAAEIDPSDEREDAGSRADAVVLDDKILECRILENLDKTIDKFDSERTQLTSGDSNEEKDSFSTDSIQSRSPSSAKSPKDGNLLDTFNSSWDSGVGVDVGNGSGWVRIHTGIESSLVYLTLDTTAKDVCRDMLLGDDLSLFVQVNGNLRS